MTFEQDMPLAMKCLRISVTEEELKHLIPFEGIQFFPAESDICG
jgi:hypothetical protein